MFALTAVVALAAGQDPGPLIPALNLKVAKYASDHKGKQVGNGECWTLAADALTDAGAQRPGADGFGIYDFGRKLSAAETVFPGDIVQFTTVVFTRKSADGKTKPIPISFPQHTGVISKVDGKNLTMWHQNFGGKKTVESFGFNLDERTSGTVDLYRPRPKKAVPTK